MNSGFFWQEIKKVIDLPLTEAYYGNQIGLIDDFSFGTGTDLISFIDDIRYKDNIKKNKLLRTIFITPELWECLGTPNILPILCDDPRYYFYTLYNHYFTVTYKKEPTSIAKSAKIHPRAFISDNNVVIGDNVTIGPNVSVLSDVEIDDNTSIYAGAVLGSEGFELKRTKHGILSVKHNGKLIIGKNVQVGNNSTIYKGFQHNNTYIGDSTKIDNLVYIAHGVKIGKECFIIGNSMISGSSIIGDCVWIGPGSTISNKIRIGNNAIVSLGSVVTKDVLDNEHVTGNFAINHERFIEIIKKNR